MPKSSRIQWAGQKKRREKPRLAHVSVLHPPSQTVLDMLGSREMANRQIGIWQCSTPTLKDWGQGRWPIDWLACDSVLHHHHHHYHHHHQSLNCEGRWGTKDDFAFSFLHFSLFSTALWDLPNSRPVHSLMLSSHLFLCLPCLLPPFTVPCKMVLARPDERETWPYHCSLRLLTIVRRSSCGPIACWILARNSSLVTWSLYEMCSILQ